MYFIRVDILLFLKSLFFRSYSITQTKVIMYVKYASLFNSRICKLSMSLWSKIIHSLFTLSEYILLNWEVKRPQKSPLCLLYYIILPMEVVRQMLYRIIHFPFICSNIPKFLSYVVYISQLIIKIGVYFLYEHL